MALVSLIAALGFLGSGCRVSTTTAGATSNAQADRMEFDAGVIFAGESNYLCIPFERLGLAFSTQITSIETSCECVQGSVVSYLTPNKATAQAIRLDFAPEPLLEDSEFVPMLLSVQVALEIEGVKSKREFSVNLRRSVRIGGLSVACLVPGTSDPTRDWLLWTNPSPSWLR